MLPRFRLDPQAQAVLDRAQAQGAKPLSSMPPVAARAAYKAGRLPTQPVPPVEVVCRELAAAGPAGPIPVREYRPAACAPAEVLPALVFFHGGGWVVGDRDTHDVLCRSWCLQVRCAVFSVDYRLAPEHRFPAAFDDACAATQWLAQQAPKLFIDAGRMAVGGDSAGANLAAAVTLALRAAPQPRLVAQMLAYPVTDVCGGTASYHDCAEGYVLSAADMHYFRSHYVADAAQYTDWRVSPLRAASLAQLPPALVVTAGFDPLRDEGRLYADSLSAAGNAVQFVCFERQMHGFLGMGGVIEEANTAVRLCGDWLARYLR